CAPIASCRTREVAPEARARTGRARASGRFADARESVRLELVAAGEAQDPRLDARLDQALDTVLPRGAIDGGVLVAEHQRPAQGTRPPGVLREIQIGRYGAAPQEDLLDGRATEHGPARRRGAALGEAEGAQRDLCWRVLAEDALAHEIEVAHRVADLVRALELRHPRRADLARAAPEVEARERLGRD